MARWWWRTVRRRGRTRRAARRAARSWARATTASSPTRCFASRAASASRQRGSSPATSCRASTWKR
eukprot:6279495-Prymnesium_polylepis.1